MGAFEETTFLLQDGYSLALELLETSQQLGVRTHWAAAGRAERRVLATPVANLPEICFELMLAQINLPAIREDKGKMSCTDV